MNANEKYSLKPRLPTSIHFDNPIGRKEAKCRGIDAALSRLLIEGELNVLAELIHGCCPSNKAIYIHAIGQFTSLEKLASVFNEAGVEVFTDHGLLSVKNIDQVNLVFSRWDAEILTVFFADQTTSNQLIGALPKLHSKWWIFSQEGFEAPYLKQLQLADPFFFFSPTRSSLEILGSKNEIFECFRKLVVLENG